MIVYQLLWAAFMSCLLGFAFYRSWRWEHGEYQERITLFNKKASKDTVVWMPATILLWFIGIFFTLELIMVGGEEGLWEFSAFTLDIMVLLSVYFAVLLVILPLLRKKFSARACATLWIAPVFMFYMTNTYFSTLPLPKLTIYIPRPVLRTVLWVWLTGFAAVEGYYLISHWCFVRRIRENARPIGDSDIINLWNTIAEELEYRKDVELIRSDAAQTPFSMGRTNMNRRTVLPVRDYAPEELSMIFRHEIHHLQRWDVNTKIFIAFCRALCWWNPLVWLATKKAAEDLELSCDEIVTENMGRDERKAYAQLLLNSAAPQQGFTTCLSATAETLRYRLKHVVNIRPKATGTLLVMLSLFTCMMCFGVTALADQRDSYTALLLQPDAKIQSISFTDPDHSGEVYQWDEAALREALGSVTVEHLASHREGMPGGIHQLHLVVYKESKTHFIDLDDNLVRDLHLGKNMRNQIYFVKSAVDWDAVRAALDFDAPPKPSPLMPEMFYTFTDHHEAESFYATCPYASAQDGETGEVLRQWSDESQAGGIHGAKVSEVSMKFSHAPNFLSVMVENWDRSKAYIHSFDTVSLINTMPLPDYAAHYTVTAHFYYGGIRYEAEYIFDVNPNGT